MMDIFRIPHPRHLQNDLIIRFNLVEIQGHQNSINLTLHETLL